jgi:small neutral amino acid transporter SnatA (MarC family)
MDNPKTTAKSRSAPPSKLWMYASLVPVFGVVPSLMVLSRDRSNQAARNVSKASILLALIWLSTYTMLGGDHSGDSFNISIELFKGTLTSGYFMVCIWLMFKLYKGQNVSLPWSERSTRKRE